nr:sigma-70 family RNA polymerase sigma factor [Duganella guangzhouensis]
MIARHPVHKDAFSEVYREHHGWLFHWLWRKLGCRSGAADLTQDTFVRVLSADTAADLREPRAYLSRVASNLLANHWRHVALEREYLAALAAQPELLAPSPEEQATMMDTLRRLDDMLRGLSDKARQVFLLSQLEGMPYAAIASQMSISERMVKKYMAQAMFQCALMADAP